MAVSRARQAAFDILLRVETDAAYSSELLHSERFWDRVEARTGPAGERLAERDRALATEIVLGCLRWQGELDSLAAQSARRPMERLDPEVRIALRMGAYQLRHLTRIPDSAAVSESVELVKRGRKRSAAGFVNAVLRRLPQQAPEARSQELAHPAWLIARWRRIYGEQLTGSLLRANLQPPGTYLRLNARFDFEETLGLLEEEGVATEPTELPWARRVIGGRATATRCYREGRIRIQDLSSQTIVPLLQLAAQHRFLDVCAAPGGKTYQAAELLGTSRHMVAADRHLHRLRRMRELATLPVALVAVDAEAPLPFRQRFDRILVDAPCSGTGTLARNPEIKWRLREQDLASLSLKQQGILRRSLECLSPGGILVYSTCSLEPEENQAVVEAVLRERTEFEAGAYQQRIPGRDRGEGFFACRIRHR